MTWTAGNVTVTGWIVDAIGSIVADVGYLWRTITKFLRRYARVLGALIAGLVVGYNVRLFAGDWTSLWSWGFAATLVVFGITIGIIFYSVFRERKHAERYREYMEMLNKVNEERDARYKMFFDDKP